MGRRSWIVNLESWILDLQSWILGLGSRICWFCNGFCFWIINLISGLALIFIPWLCFLGSRCFYLSYDDSYIFWWSFVLDSGHLGFWISLILKSADPECGQNSKFWIYNSKVKDNYNVSLKIMYRDQWGHKFRQHSLKVPNNVDFK